MSARVFIIIMTIVHLFSMSLKVYLTESQKKRRLSKDVSVFFSSERYSEYMNYFADSCKIRFFFAGVSSLAVIALYSTDVFRVIDNITKGKQYNAFFISFFIFNVGRWIADAYFEYSDTHFIREKYHLDMHIDREKDSILSITLRKIVNITKDIGLRLLIILLAERVSINFKTSSPTFGNAVLYATFVILVPLTFSLALAAAFYIFSYWRFKESYTFKPMPRGNLRRKIEALQINSPKKLKRIYIYNESKWSTAKKVFFSPIPWKRELVIADNYLTDNLEKELLAVLSHNFFYLKQRKTGFLLLLIIGLIAFVGATIGMSHRTEVNEWFYDWIRESFCISSVNYYLYIELALAVILPFRKLVGIVLNYFSRRNEFQADLEVVKNGYGKELIAILIDQSSEKLINFDPHPILEFLDYSQPGLVRRIYSIQAALNSMIPGLESHSQYLKIP